MGYIPIDSRIFIFKSDYSLLLFGMGIPGVEPSVNIPIIGGVIAFFFTLGFVLYTQYFFIPFFYKE